MKNRQVARIRLKLTRKISLIILWLCLILLIIQGSISILKPPGFGIKDVEDITDKANGKRLIANNAISFAENFTKEYMTNYGDLNEYKCRLNKFVADDLQYENTKVFSASYVNSINHHWVKDNTLLVDCLVSGITENTIINNKLIPKEEIFYIRVAVNILDNRFLINNLPTFISEPKVANQKDPDILKGTELEDDNKKTQIKKVVCSFLKAYYEGQNTEIQYFTENPKISESKKPFAFDEIKDLKINWDENNLFYVKTSYYVAKSEARFIQNMELKLKMVEDKLIITKYNTKI